MNIRDVRYGAEFEVQSIAYMVLSRKYRVVGEITVRDPGGGRGARFDLVVLRSNGDFALTIEVKRRAGARQHGKREHYERLAGCPNVQISGRHEAWSALEICEPYLTAST